MHGPESLFLMIFGVVVGLPIARAYARRLERRGTLPPQSGDIMERLQRMEQTMEAIATEVERIAEGQRFTTKLLAASAERTDRIGAGGA
ncbi:MAG TPA: hypothetical protein VGT98_07955 [Candidatus Elarobacter sp.]|nr:hypothetical protein [Candidatus Elarobacter sp.]